MTTIDIARPIGINMEVIEIDNYLPSFKMSVKIVLKHPTGKFVYDAEDIWFECDKWDSFTLFLNRVGMGASKESSINNISESFFIGINSENEILTFSFKAEEANIGDGRSQIFFKSVIDRESFEIIKETFTAFEKWW